MRVLAVALIVGTLAGCLDSQPDPHELVTCEGWTDNAGIPLWSSWRCELACQTMPTAAENTCGPSSREFDGQAGTCVPTPGSTDVVKWEPCP